MHRIKYRDAVLLLALLFALVQTMAGLSVGAASAPSPVLNDPQDIAFDQTGNMYIADTGNNRVVKFDSSGTPVLQIQINRPTSVFVDVYGDIYASEGGHIKVYSAAGVHTRDAAPVPLASIANISDLAVSHDGSLYYYYSLDQSTIRCIPNLFGCIPTPSDDYYYFSPSGNMRMSGNNSKLGLAVDQAGAVWRSVYGPAPGKVQSTGGATLAATASGMTNPGKIAVDSAGKRLYVVDGGSSIKQFDLNNLNGGAIETLTSIGGKTIANPKSIAVHPAGSLYVLHADGTLSSSNQQDLIPSTPTGLSGTAGNAKVTLNWTVSERASEYEVFMHEGAVAPADPAHWRIAASSVTSVVYEVYGLTNGTAYTFSVKAKNMAGKSDFSNTVTTTPMLSVPLAPSAPRNLSATAGNRQAIVTFAAPTDNGGSAIASYEVKAWTNGSVVKSVYGTSSPITVTGLINGTTYTFTATATNAAGGTSAPSTPSAPVTPFVPSTNSNTWVSTGGLSSYTEQLSIQVENGIVGGKLILNVTLRRTTDAQGIKKDEIELTADQASKIVEQLKNAGSSLARIVIPDSRNEVSEVNVSIPKAVAALLSKENISLELSTNHAQVMIPSQSMKGLEKDIYFRLMPVRNESDRQAAESRAKTDRIVRTAIGDSEPVIIGKPIKIETNLQNESVTLILPLGDNYVSDKPHGVFVEHSDGTKEWVQGEIVKFDDKGKSGVRFTVSKFSTFTPVQFDKAARVPYISGYMDGTFGPDRNVTRAEIATMLSRAFPVQSKNAEITFTDYVPEHWALKAIQTSSKAGLVQGYPDGSFKPERTITRAEMASIAARLLADKPKSSAAGSFTDIDGHWAKTAIENAKQAGILNGFEDQTFRPDDELTRGEAVMIINKLLGWEPLTNVEPKWSDVTKEHWAYGAVQAASVQLDK